GPSAGAPPAAAAGLAAVGNYLLANANHSQYYFRPRSHELATMQPSSAPKLRRLPAVVLACASAGAAHAQSSAADDAAPFERLTVIGSRPAELTGGSASFLTTEQLERFRHTDVHRALRQVPGLYVVEEDGFGLRPNIGLSGSGA